MAHTLRLNYGGTTYNLNSGSAWIRRYVPESPNISTIDSNTILVDGGDRTLTTRRNVTEACEVMLQAPSGSASEIHDAKTTIQQWLLQAENYSETQSGSRVYVEYAPDGMSGSIYRSELLGGKVNIADDSLDTRWTKNRAIELDIVWTRKHFWEGDEITVTLENSGCTSTCATVWNQNPLDFTGQSGCYNNWVQISGSNVVGELPTPATIEIHNQSTNITGPTYHLFHGINRNITSLPTTLEAEDADYTTGSTNSSACTSGGNYNEVDFFNATSWTPGLRFTIASGSLQNWAGEKYNIYLQFADDMNETSDVFVRASFRDNQVAGLVTIEEGPATGMSARAGLSVVRGKSIGVVQLPPSILDTGDELAEQRFYLDFKNYDATQVAAQIDCIYFMPTDGYRYIWQSHFSQDNGEYVVDYGSENKVLLSASGDKKFSLLRWRGNPIHLQPGKDQRIYLVHNENAGSGTSVDPFRKHGIKVKYRPRRLTI